MIRHLAVVEGIWNEEKRDFDYNINHSFLHRFANGHVACRDYGEYSVFLTLADLREALAEDNDGKFMRNLGILLSGESGELLHNRYLFDIWDNDNANS